MAEKAECTLSPVRNLAEPDDIDELYYDLQELPTWAICGSLALANCPDNDQLCSLIVSLIGTETNPFVHVFFNKNEVDAIIEALQKIRKKMDFVNEKE